MNNDNVQNKLRKLVQQLASGTAEGRIAWADTGDDDAFRAKMQGGMVRVQKQVRFDEENHEYDDFSLTLLDQKGREVEEYSPGPFEGANDLANLWSLARRAARGSVDVLDKLLRETATVE